MLAVGSFLTPLYIFEMIIAINYVGIIHTYREFYKEHKGNIIRLKITCPYTKADIALFGGLFSVDDLTCQLSTLNQLNSKI
jgi:hypothetical protein